jgi:hypothetical protein
MKLKSTTSWATVLAALLLSSAPSAHHAARMFELTTPIRVKGTVVRYVWANPHSAILVEQKTENGKAVRWALESSAPIHLLETRGFTRDSFKPGDVIEACGFAPRSAFRDRSDTPNRSTDREPVWLDGADRAITARLLVTKDGPLVHWSHYGPLDLCISEEELAARSR